MIKLDSVSDRLRPKVNVELVRNGTITWEVADDLKPLMLSQCVYNTYMPRFVKTAFLNSTKTRV